MNEVQKPMSLEELEQTAKLMDRQATDGLNQVDERKLGHLQHKLAVAGMSELAMQVIARFGQVLNRKRGEQLAKDSHLAVLPSGAKVSTRDVRHFHPGVQIPANRDIQPGVPITYGNGDAVWLYEPADIFAFNAALNRIGVYVNAPTLPGEDADGDGKVG